MSGGVPVGMVSVSRDEFFAALFADPRDIMPSHMHPDHTTWETKHREVWGWSRPGWKSPDGTPGVYAVVASAVRMGAGR